ncbi:hypothetical protein ABEB36_003647 [Hypothenemus hampei]|uniref:Uncharacterized protein n=1 Tax=Hypothenemus hampei TaxID=57062 RepID=A0ABD1F9U7_HYPHA
MNYLFNLVDKKVLIFLFENGASEEKHSRELFSSKLNWDFKNNFYFGKNHWHIIFFLKNIQSGVRLHAIGRSNTKVFTAKYVLFVTLVTKRNQTIVDINKMMYFNHIYLILNYS